MRAQEPQKIREFELDGRRYNVVAIPYQTPEEAGKQIPWLKPEEVATAVSRFGRPFNAHDRSELMRAITKHMNREEPNFGVPRDLGECHLVTEARSRWDVSFLRLPEGALWWQSCTANPEWGTEGDSAQFWAKDIAVLVIATH